MVERLFTADPFTNDNECQCNVTNLINETDSFYENIPNFNNIERNLLPTINENLEGFESQFAERDKALLPTRFTIRNRRNSHPASFRESQTSSNLPTRKPAGLKCKQGQIKTKCRKCCSRDPMLSFKVLPKEDNIVFHKHKLDKIDEGDAAATELCEENDPKYETTSRNVVQDKSIYSMGRRRSYPTDSSAFLGTSVEQGMGEDNIVSKWMKFF